MSDYMFVLESHLNANQNRATAEMARVATDTGIGVWLTGGAMRDMLRGAPIRDLDFTVERDPIKNGKALVDKMGGRVISEDALKRWIELELPGDVRASVSAARLEKYTKPGGKPQISQATIHEDLLRRDFTINAIGLSLNRGSRGLLIDPANGQADLSNKELRATNSSVFFDDPARLFRLIRFQYVLGFQLPARTQSQFENALLENYVNAVPATHLATEIRALAMEPKALAALEALDEKGLLKHLSPALTGPGLNAHGLARLEKLVETVLPAGTQRGWLAFLHVLVEKLSLREKTDFLQSLQMPKEEAEQWKKLEPQAKKLEMALKSARVTRPSHVYEVLHHATCDEVLMVLYHSAQRVVQDRVRAYYQKYLPAAQEVTEEQVIATGIKPGTPKFEKTWRTMVSTHLNARPKKVVPIEPEPQPGPVIAPMGIVRAVRK